MSNIGGKKRSKGRSKTVKYGGINKYRQWQASKLAKAYQSGMALAAAARRGENAWHPLISINSNVAYRRNLEGREAWLARNKRRRAVAM